MEFLAKEKFFQEVSNAATEKSKLGYPPSRDSISLKPVFPILGELRFGFLFAFLQVLMKLPGELSRKKIPNSSLKFPCELGLTTKT